MTVMQDITKLENPNSVQQMNCLLYTSLYALGALASYESLYDIEEVTMHIFQPRRENVSAWTISVDELRKWAENDLVPKAKLAFKGEGE